MTPAPIGGAEDDRPEGRTRRRVLMLVQSPVAGDSRVLREAQALAAAGHAVHVVGRGVPEGFEGPDGVSVDSVGRGSGLRPGGARGAGTRRGGIQGRGTRGAGTRGAGTRGAGTWSGGMGGGVAPGFRPGARALRPALDAARWLLLPEHRARVERAWRAGAGERVRVYIREHGAADVVHAHDFNTLELAAEVAARTGAALVYDSHEFWRGRARHGRPEPLRRRRAAAREDALLPRTDLVLTVSDGIADRLRAGGARRVVVVRNSFPARTAAAPLPRQPTGLVYAGRIGPGRDLETLADAAPGLAAVGVRPVVVGPADADHLARLRARVDGKRVELRPEPLPLDEVDEVYRREGLAVVSLDDSCENHRLALPNKLFHAVRAGIPVIAADLPELSKAVRGQGIGATYRPGDADSLAAAVAEVAGRYQDALAAVAAVQELYRWERDAEVLVEAYDGLPLRRAPGVPAPVGSPAR